MNSNDELTGDGDEDEDVMGKRVLPFMVAHPVGAVEDYIITWVVFKNILPYPAYPADEK